MENGQEYDMQEGMPDRNQPTDEDIANRLQVLCDRRQGYDFSQTPLARANLLSPKAEPGGRIVILCQLISLTALQRKRPLQYCEAVEEMERDRHFPFNGKTVGGRSVRSAMNLLLELVEVGLINAQ